jgi:hypothetical protein
MGRVAVAILWMVIAGSADAAYMKGTLTYDDGRTATLMLRRFFKGGSPNLPLTYASFRCSGDACFNGSGIVGFDPPFRGGYFLAFDEIAFDSPSYDCSILELQKHPGTCRIASPVVCEARNPGPPNTPRVVATGMLDLHRPTPRCRRAVRRAGQ